MEDNNGTPENVETPSVEVAAPTAVKLAMETPTKEVSAATIGRMMGLATVSDLKLLDSKVDLLSTKVAGLVMKLDKALNLLAAMPTGSDLERIDIQVGGVKTAVREAVQTIQDTIRDKK